jgi:hypothetical protein
MPTTVSISLLSATTNTLGAPVGGFQTVLFTLPYLNALPSAISNNLVLTALPHKAHAERKRALLRCGRYYQPEQRAPSSKITLSTNGIRLLESILEQFVVIQAAMPTACMVASNARRKVS